MWGEPQRNFAIGMDPDDDPDTGPFAELRTFDQILLAREAENVDIDGLRVGLLTLRVVRRGECAVR